MEKAIALLIKRRFAVLLAFAILVILALGLLPLVEVNYDMAQYLPSEAKTKRAIAVLEEEFGYPGMADVMVKVDSLAEAATAKAQIEQVEGVKSVVWLDDLTDITAPLPFIPDQLQNQYYREGYARFQVEFTESDYSIASGEALEAIRDRLGPGVSITGSAENSRHMRGVLASEILKIILVVLPLCIIILIFASHSWVEPLLYLVIIGVSIAINMGTNAFFGSISFITHAMAAILQLAISMDYSLFLSHRYTEERDRGKTAYEAVITATKKSISSISASSLTTIAGFLALVFMQYSIGADLGLVLAKGILISFITVLTLMPALLVSCDKIIQRTKHKQLMPPFKRLGRMAYKLRYPLIILIILVLIPSYLAQDSNTFLYGDTSGSTEERNTAQEHRQVEELFGTSNPVMLLVPNDNIAAEILLADQLAGLPQVSGVRTLVTMADPAIPRELLPQALRDSFLSSQYCRMIVDLDVYEEGPELFAAVESIEEHAQQYYPDRWLAAGKATSIADIRDTVESDNIIVSLFSVLAVGLIILLTFRSLLIPVLLVSVIQTSIWINMGVPYFAGAGLIFIGYLMIKALQLGATIDYAILMSNRYMEYRTTQPPKSAALSALGSAGSPVLVSALILSVAGFAEGLLSQIDAISEIGILLGRGAALSGILVLTLLPVLLVIFDRAIMFTTLHSKEIRLNKKLGA